MLPIAETPTTLSMSADSASAEELLSTGEYSSSRDTAHAYVAKLRAEAAETTPVVNASKKHTELFHWGHALTESSALLGMQHTYLWFTDRHPGSRGGALFNHYFVDYLKSLRTWANHGWGDGDPFLDNYIGHPIQGALTGYIEVNNDPRSQRLEFSNTREYWHSRMRAMWWNAFYSLQWEIGPFSELTVEKYGIHQWRDKHGNEVDGTGQVDLVITPIGGLGWTVAEDAMDKYWVRKLEAKTSHRWLRNTVRCALNPIRSGAMILHGNRPWYRPSRDPAH